MGYDGVRTSVLCPGHIGTELFKGFQQPIIPTLSPRYVAEQCVDAVVHDRPMVCLPYMMTHCVSLKATLPISWSDWLGRVTGMTAMMDEIDTTQADSRMEMMGVG